MASEASLKCIYIY